MYSSMSVMSVMTVIRARLDAYVIISMVREVDGDVTADITGSRAVEIVTVKHLASHHNSHSNKHLKAVSLWYG